MALSSPSPNVPPLDSPLLENIITRSDSRASNVSSASAASLTRRPRIRGRTRTLTISSARRGKSLGPPSASDEARMVTAEEMYPTPPLPSGSLVESPLPERPARSPLRSSASPVEGPSQQDLIPAPSNRAVDDAEGAIQARKMRVDEEEVKQRRTRKRGSSVPRDYRFSLLSGASSPTSPLFSNHGPMQTMPHFHSLREARQRLRDSYLTQQSGTTTSVYPFSSSTLSGTDSPPSPRSLVDSFQDIRVSSVDPDEPGDEYRSFDADDVSYRLRLLVNNSYFLPPAHSKPSPSDLAPVVKKPVKSPAPNFLDIFRGKSKPRPDVSPLEIQTPILRTTSDSTTASGWVTRPHAQSLPHSPLSPRPRPQPTRVAVVRETLDDLVTAAKQAEQDIKARAEAQARKSGQDGQKEKAESFIDVIDPTDAVDLPAQAADSPFAVQTSAMHGLGIEESVGAAILAERLPPPGSPGVWSLDPEEEAWRKALLQEAVGHSLNTTPASSTRLTVSVAPRSPTSPSSGRISGEESSSPRPARSPTPSVKRNLGQRIVLHEEQVAVASSSVPLPVMLAPPLSPSQRKASLRITNHERRPIPQLHSNTPPPERAETPATPHRPLAPPPRKQNTELPYHSPSQSLTHTAEGDESWSRSQTSISSRGVRKASSSPLLREAAIRSGRSAVSMTPPPVPRGRVSSATTSMVTPRHSESLSQLEHHRKDSLTSGSHYSVEDRDLTFEIHVEPDLVEDDSRPSFASSLPSRPSISEYSQPSPTVSAFQDALYDGYENSSSPSLQASGSFDSSTGTEQGEPSPFTRSPFARRQATMSPPPRTSSSLATNALFPPPRSSSFQSRSPLPPLAQFLASSPRPSVSSSDPGHSQYASAVEGEMDASRRNSPLPPYPLGNRVGAPGTLQVPAGLHISPALASPIEFFDRIQMDHNAMDDLETSDESDSETGDGSVYSDARTREADAQSSVAGAPFMPGANSTPYGSPSPSRDDVSSVGSLGERLIPIVNVPPRATYFKEAKGEQALSNHDLLQYTRDAASSSTAWPVDRRLADVSSRRDGRTASLQRLDGLLIQHMEAERDTLSRIAKTAKETKP